MTMAGRVCLVTGATSGLGLATASALAQMDATVILAGRTPQTCAAAVAAVRAQAPAARVDWVAADLASQGAVRALAEEVGRRHDRLDVLVNNAGAVFQRRRESPEGIELTLAVNHLAPFLLTTLLVDALLVAAPSRVVTVASVAHETADLDADDLDPGGAYRPYRAYARTKLANVMFTYELARRLEGTGVTANAVDPGLVRTEIGAKGGWLTGAAWRLTQRRHRRQAVGPADGAATIVYAASSPDLEGVSGAYLRHRRRVPSSTASMDRAAWARLWAASARLTGLDAAPDALSEPRTTSG